MSLFYIFHEYKCLYFFQISGFFDPNCEKILLIYYFSLVWVLEKSLEIEILKNCYNRNEKNYHGIRLFFFIWLSWCVNLVNKAKDLHYMDLIDLIIFSPDLPCFYVI